MSSSNIEASRKVWKTLRPLLKIMGMEDWDIRVACKLGGRNKDDEKVLMEVNTDRCEYKKANITVFEISNTFREDLIHELLHAKIGLLTGAYKKAMTQYESAIAELITHNEERVVTDLQQMVTELETKK